MKITVDDFVNYFINQDTGLPENRIMIVNATGELVFDSNESEDSDYGIIELPVLSSLVQQAFISNNVLTLVI